MQRQQTQKLEATLSLVDQDLQERQGNPSGPRALIFVRSWETLRQSN